MRGRQSNYPATSHADKLLLATNLFRWGRRAAQPRRGVILCLSTAVLRSSCPSPSLPRYCQGAGDGSWRGTLLHEALALQTKGIAKNWLAGKVEGDCSLSFGLPFPVPNLQPPVAPVALLFNSFILSCPVLPCFLPEVEATGGSSPLGGTKPALVLLLLITLISS